MQLRPDDDVYRFEPVLREVRGWELPFVARYVVWAAWAIIFVPILFLTALVTPFGVVTTVLISVSASAAIAYFVADKINPENTLDSVITSTTAELSAWGLDNKMKAKAKAERPGTLYGSHFNALDEIKPVRPFKRNRKETHQ